VDDNPAAIDVMRKRLPGASFEVAEAGAGSAAGDAAPAV